MEQKSNETVEQPVELDTAEAPDASAKAENDGSKDSYVVATEVEQVVLMDENPRQKSGIWGNVFFVASIVLSLYLMYSFARSNDLGNEKGFVEVFSNLNVTYLMLSIITVLAMMFLDSLKYVVIMRATNIKARYGTALKVGLLGKFYDNITPFSSGGQPMQIYYLHKKGISGGQSSAVIFIKFAFNMTMWLLICFCLMLFNRGVLTTHVEDLTQRNLLTIAGWIGFVVNCALPLLILFCVIFPRMTLAITRGVLHIGYKLRIVKDKEKQLERGKKVINDFISAFVSMIKKPFHSIVLAVLCFAEPFLGMVLPFFVVMALGGSAVVPSAELMFAIMTLNVYAQMSATIVPTPGNSGAVESAFMMALASVSTGVLFWTGFSWRFLSYYSYIIIGVGMTIFQLIRNYRRRKKRLQ